MIQAPNPHPLNRMKVAPIRVYGKGRVTYLDTYAVLDTAAGDCLCSRELMDLLGLEGDPRQTAVISATGTTEVSTAHYLTIEIQGYRTKEIFPIQAIALNNLTNLSEHIPSQSDIDRHPHMRGLKIPDHQRKMVDVLICIGESHLQHSFETRMAAAGQLWASCTGLGWVVHGRDSNQKKNQTTANSTVQVNAVQAMTPQVVDNAPIGESEILEKVRHAYALDFCEPQHLEEKMLSRTERRMLQRQQETFRLVNGKCEVGKLWKRSPHDLPNNREHAEKSLRSLGRRLEKNPQLLKQYQEFIGKLIENNQARVAPAPLGNRPGWFLIHHPVLEKFRVVFNGRAPYEGEFLNARLDKGPEHTSSLLGTVLRFRKNRYAFSADIKGMFYNVGIPEADQDFMRFLWWKDGDPRNPIIESCLNHQVPGLTDAPSNACFALQEVVRINPAKVSKPTCDAVKDNFYMDDCCYSGSEFEKTKAVIEEMPKALAAGGFHLTKFMTNDPALLTGIPKEDHKPREEGALFKVLGISWDPTPDKLKVQFPEPTQPATRRGILSYVMTPFDPVGIALPYLMDMKRLVQKLFSGGGGWNTPVIGENLEEWTQWCAELQEMEPSTCNRALIPRPGYQAIYLCTFSDASEKGYAAVSYIVCEYADGCTVSFGLGRVRVAPRKIVSMPRLELLGAVLAVEVANIIKKALKIEFTDTYFWVDSTAVLHWINNPDLQLKTFVGRRVDKVFEGIDLFENTILSYVSTDDNPADVGSRGVRPSNKERIKLWQEGPAWLKNRRETWPISDGSSQKQPSLKDLEIKKINAVKVTACPQIQEVKPLQHLFEKYSSLEKLKTSASWLLRLRHALHTKSKQCLDPKSPLTAAETDQALLQLARAAQWTCFPNLMEALSSQPPLSDDALATIAKKQLRNMRELTPYLDEYGLLRVGGRLQRAELPFEQTHPLILPKRHELTGLLIADYH